MGFLLCVLTIMQCCCKLRVKKCFLLFLSFFSSKMEDILGVLVHVNREVSKGVFLNKKQMPEPKYTLTKKVVLKYMN